MKDDEENAFELDGLVVKPKTGKTSPKATHKASSRSKKDLFARITKRHCTLLATVERPATAWPIFCHLMMCSVKVFNHPFALPVDYLTKETGMNRRAQVRALHALANTGIIKIGRGSRYTPPLITIPGTTKAGCKTT